MNLEKSHSNSHRLLGIDLFRGIAAYGVVVIHGLGEIPRDVNALFISNAFVSFCVPFFLVTAFYFSQKILLSKGITKYIINRVNRILLPYLAWTVIYLFARYLGTLIGNKASFNRLISDPFNIIFFGAASVQLYFLPLLFCGSLVAIPLFLLYKNIKNGLLLLLFFLSSIYLFDSMIVTGNDFALGEGIAFKHLLNITSLSKYWFFPGIRLFTVFLAWTIKCLPYISFSLLFTNVLSPYFLRRYGNGKEKISIFQLILVFLFPLIIGLIFLVRINFLYLLLPYLSFIYAIWISNLISQNIAISKVSLKLGYFSYGIYLSHALITAGFLPVMNKLFPQMLSFQLSPLMLILSSSVIFTLSLVMTYLISLNKTAAKVLLAA